MVDSGYGVYDGTKIMGRTVKEFSLAIRWFPTFTSTELYSTVYYSAVLYSTLRAEHERPIACLVQTLELSETPCPFRPRFWRRLT